MKKDGVKLSPKYGVNPTLPLCFWCGKERGDIALLGHIGDGRKGEDIEAPKHMVIDYEPCDECKKNMTLGVTCIEVDETATDNRPPIGEDCYPTGRWVVLKEKAAQRIFAVQFHGQKKLLVPWQIFSKLFCSE